MSGGVDAMVKSDNSAQATLVGEGWCAGSGLSRISHSTQKLAVPGFWWWLPDRSSTPLNCRDVWSLTHASREQKKREWKGVAHRGCCANRLNFLSEAVVDPGTPLPT